MPACNGTGRVSAQGVSTQGVSAHENVCPGSVCLMGGVCIGGVCITPWETPPPPEMATEASGSHPTGMHSSINVKLLQVLNFMS